MAPAFGDFMIATVLAARGQKEEARATAERLEHSPAGQGPPRAFNLACIRAALGNRDLAFQWLERAYADGKITRLKVEPLLDPLRKDPRYAALLDKAGLPR